MITSPSASEGKSTTTANLAVAYAETGARVLVLSCDLWRSGIARRFKVKLGRGISDFLSAGTPVPLSRFVRSTTVHGVRIVTSGVAARRRGGTLVAQRRLIDEARGLADVVLLDTTPILSASITRELATVVDAVVVVCRVGRTTASEAERCRDLLTQLGAPALGVVLVGVSGPPLADYFAYFAPRRDRAPSSKRAKAAASKTAKTTPPRAKEPTAAPEPSASEADAADEALGDGHAAERPDPAEQR
jgi:capsular exopolysaccharide synthesis family protein